MSWKTDINKYFGGGINVTEHLERQCPNCKEIYITSNYAFPLNCDKCNYTLRPVFDKEG